MSSLHATCPHCEREAAYWPILGVAYVVATWAPARYSVLAALVTAFGCWWLVFLTRCGVLRVPTRLRDALHGPTGWRALVVFLILWFAPLACPWTAVYLWR